MLKIQKPKIHDNTDPDVIAINRTKLAYNLELVRRFCFSASTTLTWFGLGITFIIHNKRTKAVIYKKYLYFSSNSVLWTRGKSNPHLGNPENKLVVLF